MQTQHTGPYDRMTELTTLFAKLSLRILGVVRVPAVWCTHDKLGHTGVAMVLAVWCLAGPTRFSKLQHTGVAMVPTA